jgi:dTDP-4-amino-4,6-dideoxygalactose transaminase
MRRTLWAVPIKSAGIGRDELMGVLHAENILARRYFYPGCHRMEPYHTAYACAKTALPVTERLTDRVLTLPTGTAVTESDIATICQIIRLVVQNGRAITERLRTKASDRGGHAPTF